MIFTQLAYIKKMGDFVGEEQVMSPTLLRTAIFVELS